MSHRYGFWRTKVLLKHPQRIVLREFLPLLGLIGISVLLMFSPLLAIIPVFAYAIVLLLTGMSHFRKGLPNVLGVPLCLVLLHTGFTIGLIDGLIRKGGASKDR